MQSKHYRMFHFLAHDHSSKKWFTKKKFPTYGKSVFFIKTFETMIRKIGVTFATTAMTRRSSTVRSTTSTKPSVNKSVPKHILRSDPPRTKSKNDEHLFF